MTIRLGTWSGGSTDNATSVSAEAAVIAAQTALDAATANQTLKDQALATAEDDKFAADADYAQALLDVATPNADLVAANADLVLKTTASNDAASVLVAANAVVAGKTSALATADGLLSTADALVITKTASKNAADLVVVAKTAVFDAASNTANIDLADATLGAATLAAYAATSGTAAVVKTYSDTHTAWLNAIAGNDHLTPSLIAAESAAFTAKDIAFRALGFYDALNGTSTQTDVSNILSGFTNPADASTDKGLAVAAATDLAAATATQTAALIALNNASAAFDAASDVQIAATDDLTAANASQVLAATAASDATSALADAVSAQQTAADTAALFDAALISQTALRDAAQAAFELATTEASNAAVAVSAATTNLSNAQSGLTGSRPVFTTSASGSDVAITVTASDTVSTLASKINAAKAGVIATVFNDGTGDRLQLRSSGIGVASGFRIQVDDTSDSVNTDNVGLSRFAYDPQVSAYGMASSGIPATYAQDAKARINGIAVTSSSNTLSSNFAGVTISLSATTTTNYNNVGGTESRSPITMGVRDDVTPVVKNVQAFVTAYNALATSLASMTKYDAATKTPSIFQGDAAVIGLQSVLRNMLGSISTGSAYQRLNDIGLERKLDGTLNINTTKLGAAANNGAELQKFFTQDNRNTLTNGFALKLSTLSKGVLASGGAVFNKAAALQKQLAQNGVEQTRVNDRAAAVEARLRKQYSALDAKMAGLSALNAYVAQQVTTWNKSTG
jgi:flagellar hook-associated protein 2